MAAAVFFCFYSYSYSEVVNTKSDNAAKFALTWAMSEVVPAYSGLTITAVNYKYTAVKATADPFVVSVQNLNSAGTGFLFRSQDDWTAKPGNTITKTVAVNNYQLSLWGRGEVKTTGLGNLKDVSVVYGYKYDTCSLVPVTDTSCPNYKPTVAEVKVPEQPAGDDTSIIANSQLILETEENLEKYRKFLLQLAEEKRLKNVVNRGTNSLITTRTIEQLKELEAANNAMAFKLYSIAMPGGTYPETVKYVDKILPDSRNSRRLSLGQQQLHNSLVDLQYNR